MGTTALQGERHKRICTPSATLLCCSSLLPCVLPVLLAPAAQLQTRCSIMPDRLQ